MARKTYTTTEPINHDGKDIPIGGDLTLDEKAAQQLLELGHIVEKKGKASPSEQSIGG